MGEKVKSVSTAGKPITAKELNMFEPMTFPKTSSGSPLRAPAIAAASSGREVPSATIVSPIISSLMPK